MKNRVDGVLGSDKESSSCWCFHMVRDAVQCTDVQSQMRYHWAMQAPKGEKIS